MEKNGERRMSISDASPEQEDESGKGGDYEYILDYRGHAAAFIVGPDIGLQGL